MEWFDFTMRVRGYQFYRKGVHIPKFILYEKIKNSPHLEDIISGRSSEYERRDSDGWRDGLCYFVWTVDPVSGRPVKERRLLPQ